MAKAKKQNFLQGALILMSAAMIVKVIGYLFKVPLKGIIGVSGFGYFNAAYGLFNCRWRDFPLRWQEWSPTAPIKAAIGT